LKTLAILDTEKISDFEQRQREQASVVALLNLDIEAQRDDFEQR
jgi:hypothetical protein